ncbi:ferredoxin [Rhizobium sp. Root268]|nr:ferredoxin [Rhizobium sp. Root268]
MPLAQSQPSPSSDPSGHLLPAGEKGSANRFFGGDGPALDDGGQARSVVLIGNIGGSLWQPFSAWRDAQPESAHPLDTWSKAVLRPLALRFGATAYFPSDPPWQPFQRWAMQAEGLKPSPLGILIHPVYGLWHGYRGAFGFQHSLEVSAPEATDHPCESCLRKPCLTHCPADAITLDGFQYQPCRTHLATEAGETGCMQAGCLARAACPVGAGYRYPPEQLRFHMAALER